MNRLFGLGTGKDKESTTSTEPTLSPRLREDLRSADPSSEDLELYRWLRQRCGERSPVLSLFEHTHLVERQSLESPSEPLFSVDRSSPGFVQFLNMFAAELEPIDYYFLGCLPKDIFDVIAANSTPTVVAPRGGVVSHLVAEAPVDHYSADVACDSISTYPFVNAERTIRSGDPVCDWYAFVAYANRWLFAVADGCNWGPAPREAAQRAVHKSIGFLMAKGSAVSSVAMAGYYLVRACMLAHRHIFKHKPLPTDAGGTTLTLGMVVEHADGSLTAVSVLVGDSKLFHWSSRSRQLVEFFSSLRSRSNGDAADSGGRLGYKNAGYEPDLHNMQLQFAPVCPDDVFLVMSDGVHDNLDPVHLAMSPALVAGVGGPSLLETFVPGVLHLTVVRAFDLVSKDSNGLSDPYCLVRLLDKDGGRRGKGQRTKTSWETLNPRWNAKFELELLDPADVLALQCWDKDLTSDDFEGEANIPVVELLMLLTAKPAVTKRFPLQPRAPDAKRSRSKEDVVGGEIEIHFSFVPFTPDELARRNLSPVPIESPSPRQSSSSASSARSMEMSMSSDSSSSSTSLLPMKLRENFQVTLLSRFLFPLPDIEPAPGQPRLGLRPLIDRLQQLVDEAPLDASTGAPADMDGLVDSLCQLKRAYLSALLERPSILDDAEPLPPQQINANLLDYCRLMTFSSRLFLETLRNRRLPHDYHRYPGKLDHTTLLSFRPKSQRCRYFFVSTAVQPELISLTVRTTAPGELQLARKSTHRVVLSVVDEQYEPDLADHMSYSTLTISQVIVLPFEVPVTPPHVASFGNNTTVYTWSTSDRGRPDDAAVAQVDDTPTSTRPDSTPLRLEAPRSSGSARRRHSSRSRKNGDARLSKRIVPSKSSDAIKDTT